MPKPKTPKNPKGAGAPNKEPTKVISVRVREKHYEKIKAEVRNVIDRVQNSNE